MAISTRCLKYLLLTYIVIYAICGFALLVLVGINLAQTFAFRTLLEIRVMQCHWIIAGMGAAALLLLVLGWMGTVKTSRSLLHLFAFILACVILVEISVAIWALVVRESFKSSVHKSLEAEFVVYDNDNVKSFDLWKEMQTRLQCCGVDGPSDWRQSSHVPWSCCSSDSPHESACQRMYQRGCAQPLIEYTALRMAQTAGLAAIAAALQIVGVVLTCFYSNSVLNDKRRANP